MNDNLRPLADAATRHHGVITPAEAAAAGVDRTSLRRHVRGGVLERIGVRTFRSPFGERGPIADLAGLVADCGHGAFASGPTAAALHGFDGFRLRRPFHVTVMRGRNVGRASHHIHTATKLDLIDRATVDGVPTLSATRTLIDLSRFVSAKALTAALDSAVRDGLTAERHLHTRIAELRASGRYGIPKLIDVIDGVEASRGGHSWLERRYLELCAGAGLSRPVTQVVLARSGGRMVRVDCRFEGTPVVVELLGYRWHRTASQLSSDARRMNALMLEGLHPFQFTHADVTLEPDRVVAETYRALDRATRRQ